MRVPILLLLGACAPDDVFVVEGEVTNVATVAQVEAIPWAVWTGDIPDEADPRYQAVETSRFFRFELDAGRWAIVGSAGACNRVLDVEGEAGTVLPVLLVITCPGENTIP